MRVSRQTSEIFKKDIAFIKLGLDDAVKISLPTGVNLTTGPGTVTSSEISAKTTNASAMIRAMKEASKFTRSGRLFYLLGIILITIFN